jgi:hypothetical protein
VSDLLSFYKGKYQKFDEKCNSSDDLSQLIVAQNSQHFGNFFNAYAKAFNKQNSRRGALFESRFKRIKVENESYLKRLVRYIHHNPVKHYEVRNITHWNFSSYNSILNKDDKIVKIDGVIDLFEDMENFKAYHTEIL